MNWVDIAILLVIFFIVLLGLKLGFIRVLFLFAGFFLGVTVSSKLSILPPHLLNKVIDNPGLRHIISFGSTFLLIFIGVNVAGSIIYKLASFTPIGWMDKLVGIVLGFLTGIILVSLIIAFLTKYPIASSDKWLSDSFLAPLIKAMVNQIYHRPSSAQPSAFLFWIFYS